LNSLGGFAVGGVGLLWFFGFFEGMFLRSGNGHLAAHDRLWKFKQDEVVCGGRGLRCCLTSEKRNYGQG